MSKILVFLFLFTFVLTHVETNPQEIPKLEIIGNGKYLPGELISKTKENYDANGNLAAIILVVSDLTGFSFQSGYDPIKTVKTGPSETRLYVSPNETWVKFSVQGFEPLKIKLSDYGIHLSEGTVWKIKITGNKKNNLIPINILRNPNNSKIYIDGEFFGTEQSHKVSPGKHVVRIEKKGYITIIDTIVVNENKTLFKYQMEIIEPVLFTINSKPQGADVYINNNLVGQTPEQFFREPGKYSIRIFKDGYIEKTKDILIGTESNNREYQFKLVKNSGLLNLEIEPKDAILRINGELKKSREIELKPDSYEVIISKINYNTIKDSVRIKLGETLDKEYILKSNVGYLKVLSDIENLSILLNNKEYETNKTLRLPSGTYKLELNEPNYYNIKSVIQVERGKTYKKKLNVKKKTGRLKFKVKPIEAKIKLFKDDQLLKSWIGSNYLDSLLIGDYKIKANFDNYKTLSKKISIKHNRQVDMKIILEKMVEENKTKAQNKYDYEYDPTLKKVPESLTVEKTIENYVEAIGGMEAVKSIEDMTMKLADTIKGNHINLTIRKKTPHKLYRILDAGIKKQKIVFDGEKGYIEMNGQKRMIKKEQILAMKMRSSIFPFLHYSKYGIDLELIGMETVDGKETYKVYLHFHNGNKVTKYYSKETGLLLKQVKLIPSGQRISKKITRLDNYLEVSGVKFPHKITFQNGQQIINFKVKEIKVNIGMKDSFFE